MNKPIKSKEEWLARLPEPKIRRYIDLIRKKEEGEGGALTIEEEKEFVQTLKGLPFGMTIEDLQEELEHRGLSRQSIP